MTSQSSSVKGRSRTEYFFFLLRQNWPTLVANMIIFLLLNVVILSMVLNNIRTDALRYSFPLKQATENVADLLTGLRVANTVVASLLAVLWGSTSMTYLNNKVSVNFYHAIPRRRESLYVQEILAKLVCLAVPALLSALIAIPITGVLAGEWAAGSAATLLGTAGYAILYFTLYFSIMCFAATFTGTAFARILAAGFVVFMPAALIACTTLILELHANYASYEFLLTWALRIFLPYRTLGLVLSHTTDFLDVIHPAREIVGTLCLALAFYLAGLLIYRRRKSEGSGTPVLSRAASGLIKYTSLFCAAVLMGSLFRLMEGWFWLGAAFGALLAFMVINTILTKSAKRMFAGWRGFAIFLAAFLAFYLIFGLDLVGLDAYVPGKAMVRGATVTVNGASYTLNEAEADAFAEALDGYLQADRAGSLTSRTVTSVKIGELYEKYDGTLYAPETKEIRDSWYFLSYNAALYMQVSLKTAMGIPVEKRFNLEKYSAEGDAILTLIADSSGFAEAYFQHMDDWSGPIELKHWFGSNAGGMERESREYASVPQELKKLRAECAALGMAYFQRPALSTLSGDVMGSRYLWFEYLRYGAAEEDLEPLMAMVSSVAVANLTEGTVTVYTDETSMRQILSACVLADSGDSGLCFTRTESDWGVSIRFTDKIPANGADYTDDFGDGYAIPDYYEGQYTIPAFFLYGHLPAFLH